MSNVPLCFNYSQTIQILWNTFLKWKLMLNVIAHCTHVIARSHRSHASFPHIKPNGIIKKILQYYI